MGVHLVTGAAGFIGSHLADALVAAGEMVRGVDCFTPYYERAAKAANIDDLVRDPRFELREVDLRSGHLDGLLHGVDVVHHLAGQPGVRLSWADGFGTYNDGNVVATQRLLEAARRTSIRRFVHASSSSVYGDAASYPVVEADLPAPHSPYGVTKLAAEHLCTAYGRNHGVPTVALRYFSVYGPRQRPDMAHHRLIEAALDGSPFPLYGDGSHVRDFTYVGDVVRAHLLAADPKRDLDPATVMNICGGTSTAMRTLIDLVGEAVGRPVEVDKLDEQPGDVARTGGSSALAGELLGWKSETTIADGIAAQVRWHVARRAGG